MMKRLAYSVFQADFVFLRFSVPPVQSGCRFHSFSRNLPTRMTMNHIPLSGRDQWSIGHERMQRERQESILEMCA
jgi:hypothetical protein